MITRREFIDGLAVTAGTFAVASTAKSMGRYLARTIGLILRL
jgi:hypothetical protein